MNNKLDIDIEEILSLPDTSDPEVANMVKKYNELSDKANLNPDVLFIIGYVIGRTRNLSLLEHKELFDISVTLTRMQLGLSVTEEN